MTVNREEFDRLAIALEQGHALTLIDLGRIFGEDFWILIVLSMLNMTVTTDNIHIHIDSSK